MKLSQLDRVILKVDGEIAALQAMKLRLLEVRDGQPKRKKPTKTRTLEVLEHRQ